LAAGRFYFEREEVRRRGSEREVEIDVSSSTNLFRKGDSSPSIVRDLTHRHDSPKH